MTTKIITLKLYKHFYAQLFKPIFKTDERRSYLWVSFGYGYNDLNLNKNMLKLPLFPEKIMYLHGSNQNRMKRRRFVVINFEHQFSKPQGSAGLSTYIYTNM